MHAWVAGATGLVGSSLVELLLANPQVGRVTTLVRQSTGRQHQKLHERVVNFDLLRAELRGAHVTHLFCALGTTLAQAGSEAAFRKVDYEYPLALAEVAAGANVEAFLVVTAIGADPNSKVFYSRVKGELERDLEQLRLNALRIFRPSLLLGKRKEHRPAEQVGGALAKPLGWLMLGPLRKYRPIQSIDVARAMLSAALNPSPEQTTAYEFDGMAQLATRAGTAP